MLGTLEADQKVDWKRYIKPLVYAYNCTPHEVSPYEFMFGRKPRLPTDSVFQQATDEVSAAANMPKDEYIQDLQETTSVPER